MDVDIYGKSSYGRGVGVPPATVPKPGAPFNGPKLTDPVPTPPRTTLPGPVVDLDQDGLDDRFEAQLLDFYRPKLMFSIDHGGEEEFRPTDALTYIRGSNVRDGASGPELLPMSTFATPAGISRLLAFRDNSRSSSTNLLVSGNKVDIRLHPNDAARHGRSWEDISRVRNIGLYGHVAPFDSEKACRVGPDYNVRAPKLIDGTRLCKQCVKIEYYQFFGMNKTFALFDFGDHEADWGIITLVLETAPGEERLMSISHWAHGYEMVFDMAAPWVSPAPTSTMREFRGERYTTDYFNLAILGDQAGFIENRPDWAQHNLVRLAQDPVTKQFTHPVAYIEFGSHELFPSEYWGVQVAPKHGGDSVHSYLSENVPNLGEVHAPLGGDEARVVAQFGGWWGAENVWNDSPAGPPLHKAWMYPKNAPSPDASRLSSSLTCDKRE